MGLSTKQVIQWFSCYRKSLKREEEEREWEKKKEEVDKNGDKIGPKKYGGEEWLE